MKAEEKANEQRLNDDIPDSVLLKYAIRESKKKEAEIKALKQKLGENESYIQELEDKIKVLIHDEDKTLSLQIKQEELYKVQRHHMTQQDKKIQSLKETINELLMKLNKGRIKK